MKNLKVMMIALVAMLCFSACDNKCDHEFVEVDYSNALVGTWSYFEDGLAEAMVIKEDGSFTITGITNGGSRHESKGTLTVVNNKISLKFESSGETLEGRLEIVAGETMSIVLNEKYDIRTTYDYCKNDLSDEIVGMWVCNDASAGGEKMMIQTFYENGKCTLTGYLPTEEGDIEQVKNGATDYEVYGDLLIITIPAEKTGGDKPIYVADKLVYAPNGTAFGDILTLKTFIEVEGEFITETFSYLRVKQNLNFAGQKYTYSSAYVTNAKGTDEDFSILGNTFNMANIEGGDFDVLFRSELFCVDLNANSIKQYFRSNGRDIEIDIPITVDGNKVTLDLSAENAAYRKVDIYMYQDADDSQLHMYMHTKAFIDYFANMELYNLLAEGKINADDTAAVEKVFADMEARIESINVSFVFKARN